MKLNTANLDIAMKRASVSSIAELCRLANIHRNSIEPYLKQERSIYQDVIEKISLALSVTPESLIKSDLISDPHGAKEIIKNIFHLELKKSYKDLAIFIFGSRAAGTAKLKSDYDIGITGGKNRISSMDGLDIKEILLNSLDDLSVSVDILNFDQAPKWFISEFIKTSFDSISLICGNEASYNQFIGRIDEAKYWI